MKRIGSDLKKAAASALALTLMTSAVSCSIFPANLTRAELSDFVMFFFHGNTCSDKDKTGPVRFHYGRFGTAAV